MSGIFDFLHIKQHTQGTSNELSFDVLEAARNQLDSKSKQGRAKGTTGMSRAGSSSASAQTSQHAQASQHASLIAPPLQNAENDTQDSTKLRSALEPATVPPTAAGLVSGRKPRGAHGVIQQRPRPFARGMALPGDTKASDAENLLSSRKSASFASAPEVQRRKKERRSYMLRFKIIGLVAVLILLCGGSFTAYEISKHRMSFNARVNNIVAQIVDVDASLVEIDDLMSDPFNNTDGEEREKMLNKMAGLANSLVDICIQAKDLGESAQSDTDQLTITEIVTAAQAREALMAAASASFGLSSNINAQVESADKAWDKVIDADQKIKEIAKASNKATTEDATRSVREDTEAAQQELKEALNLIEDIETSISGIDFSAQKAYLNKRIEALDYALDTSDALIAGDKTSAENANTKYNQLEQDAAKDAASLANSLGSVVKEAYSQQMEESLKKYSDARGRVTKADADLRGRL